MWRGRESGSGVEGQGVREWCGGAGSQGVVWRGRESGSGVEGRGSGSGVLKPLLPCGWTLAGYSGCSGSRLLLWLERLREEEKIN